MVTLVCIVLKRGVTGNTFEDSDGWICFEKGRQLSPTEAE